MTPLKKLKDISSYCTDKILKSEITSNEYISTTNMLADMKGVELATSLPPSLKLNRYESKDILIANIRPYFKKIWQADKTGGCDSDVLNIRANKNEILPEFLYYALFRKEFFDYIMVGSKGVKMPRGDKDFIMNFKIQVPSFQKQEETVSKIKPFFEKIESNNTLINNFEDYAQLLFHKWFVEFNFPDGNGNPYKDSGGEMVEVDGKMIPKNFNKGCLNDISLFYNGYSFDSESYIENGKYSVITIKNVQDGEITTLKTDTINLIPNKMPSYCKLTVGDILMSLTGNVGRVGLVTQENSLLNQRVSKIVPQKTYIYEFLYIFLRNKRTLKLAERLSNGSAQQNLSPIKFAQSALIIPPADVLMNFNALTKDIVSKIISLKIENTLLEETRDLLIKKLIK